MPSQIDTYTNGDYIKPFTDSKQPQKTEFEYIDDDGKPPGDGYLMPRHGSSMSTSTTNSTAPLLSKPCEFQPPKPKSKFDMKFVKKNYAPSPPPTKSTKLSLAATSNETEV